MGTSSSSSIKDCTARIVTKDERTFTISYDELIEHIQLLRKVIKHPEMRRQGSILDSFIEDYCKRMAQSEMKTEEQQAKLPWQIEWIWHVHRLHPQNYLDDCYRQIPGGFVDKKTVKLVRKQSKGKKLKTTSSLMNKHVSFIPSIDLTSAIIIQNDFLGKFQKHFLYSYDLKELTPLKFGNLVQDYVSFIKLASKNQMVVPTFDIDLIWHTHMRYPVDYQEFCKAVCGFILDHDDSIESYILTDAYQITANRWKQTYQSDYGEHLDRKHLQKSQDRSLCAMVVISGSALTNTGKR